MPRISGQECFLLQQAAEHIRQSIKLGEGYITGEIIDIREMVTQMEKPCDLITAAELDEKNAEEINKKEKEHHNTNRLYSR